MGLQEPVLRLLPLSRFRHSRRPHAVLEPLSLRRTSKRRRSAIADLRAGLRGLGLVRCGAVDAHLRSDRVRPSSRARAAAAALVAAVASGELVWWNAASSLNAEAPAYYSVLQEPKGEDAAILAVLEREIEARRREGKRPRVEVAGVSGSWQNLAMTRGLEATNGYNPLRIGSYDRLVSPGETTHIVDQRLFPPSFDGYDGALARELGLQYLVLGQPIEKVPHLGRRPVADLLLAGPKAWVYRLAGPEPRVKLLTRVTVADADAQVRAGRFQINPAAETASIDDDTAPLRREWPMLTGRRGNSARIVSWRPDRVEVEVDSARPGVLVLARRLLSGLVRRGGRAAGAAPARRRSVPRGGGGRRPPPRGVPLRPLLACQSPQRARRRAASAPLGRLLNCCRNRDEGPHRWRHQRSRPSSSRWAGDWRRQAVQRPARGMRRLN